MGFGLVAQSQQYEEHSAIHCQRNDTDNGFKLHTKLEPSWKDEIRHADYLEEQGVMKSANCCCKSSLKKGHLIRIIQPEHMILTV